ncbi:MAG: hypothetical protein ACI9WU_005119 [Myxococcota bacterium]|jgi:hypothetical protein
MTLHATRFQTLAASLLMIGLLLPLTAMGALNTNQFLGSQPQAYTALNGPCTLSYVNGLTYSVSSCSLDASELCCSYQEWLAGAESCPSSCTCTGEEEVDVEVVDSVDPFLLRGVPVLFQHDVKPEKTANYPVGCGAVSVASVLLYYQGLGWTDLAADYEDAFGDFEWQDMTFDLADTYLKTWFFPNGSPTRPWKMEAGIEDYIADQGYSANVTEYQVRDTASGSDISTDSAAGIIKQSLLDGRPVIMGFDVSDEGGGIGGSGDNVYFIDHMAVIVGIDDTVSPVKLYVNMGWAYQTDSSPTPAPGTPLEDGISEWDLTIGDGQIYLWLIQMTAGEKNVGAEDCPTTRATSLYTPNASIGASFEDSSFDAWPLVNRLVAGDTCDVIGGETTHMESEMRDWTEEADCDGHYWLYDLTSKGENPFEIYTPGGSDGGDAGGDDGGELDPMGGSKDIPDRLDP